jgi:hypothetical protein
LIAGSVAECVVHGLEPVEVDEENGDATVQSGCASERVVETAEEQRTVGQEQMARAAVEDEVTEWGGRPAG